MPRALAVVAALALFSTAAHAQTQVGAHYASLSLEYPDQTRSGVGAFVVWGARQSIGLDVAAAVFPSDEIGGTAVQLLAGPRAGVRAGRVAVFGRVRPGLIRFSDRFLSPDVVCIAIFPPPEACLVDASSFALDLGGTVEVDLSSRAVLRVDIGDTLVRYRAGDDSAWRDALQVVVGAGWTF